MTKDVGNLDQREIDEFIQEIGQIIQYYRIDYRDADQGKLLTPKLLSSGSKENLQSSLTRDNDGASSQPKGMAESKVQYLKHMVFQYLVCREPEVKQHIERALIALFRFSEEEKAVIEAKRKEESEEGFSFSSLLGSFTT